jgi:hypothetical protein
MNAVFERLVLRQADLMCPHSSTGRPWAVSNQRALALMFRVLRSGGKKRMLAPSTHTDTHAPCTTASR